MKIFDVFLFFNELELLDLRLRTLNDHVDYFVITEATVTFTGKPKPLYYLENRAWFKWCEKKIIHNIVEVTPNDFTHFVPPNAYYTGRDVSYPHKSGGVPLSKLSLNFQREVFQRDSIIAGLIGAAGRGDLIIISDVDEIPNPAAVQQVADRLVSGTIYNFCQKWYMYYVNVLCGSEWFGTRICDFATLEGRSIDLMRYHLESRAEQPGPIVENGGWHFSFLGGPQRVRQKLAAYSYQGRRSKILLQALDRLFSQRIQKKIARNQDIFNTGRRFRTVQLDDTFPSYLLANRRKFEYFIKS